MDNNKTVIVFTSQTARKLLKMGYTIVDIKPDRNDIERKRSVYAFRDEPGLREKIADLVATKTY